MCSLCEQGVKPEGQPCAVEGYATANEMSAAAAGVSLTWSEAGDKIAEFGWSSASTVAVTYAFRSTSTESGFVRFDGNLIAQSEKAFAFGLTSQTLRLCASVAER